MNQLKRLLGQTAVYGISSILGRLLNYLLVPLYTTVFKEGEYGVVTEFYAYVAFFNVLYLFGLETTYFRLANSQNGNSLSVYNKIQTLVIFNAFIITGVLVFFAEDITLAFSYPGKESYIYYLAIVMLIDAIVAIPFARMRLENKAKRFAFTRLLNVLVVILLNLFFIVWLPNLVEEGYNGFFAKLYHSEIGVGYVFISNLIANALYIFLVSDLLFSTKIQLPGKDFKKLLNYAVPIMFLGLAGVTNEMLSRAILKYRLPDNFYEGMSNLDVLGVFGACYKLSVFMVLAIQAFKYAAEPFFFKSAQDKDSPILFSKVMSGYIIFASVLMMAVIVNLDFISGLFLRRTVYLQALPSVPWLLLGGLFLGVYYNLSVWFKVTDQTRYGAYISGVGAFFTLIFNWILIPYFGYMGSAVITSATYFLMCILSYIIGQKHLKIPYQVVRNLNYVFGVFIISLILYYFPLFEGWALFFINNTIVLLIIIIILKIEGIDLRSLIKK